jgi:hypothetical protein
LIFQGGPFLVKTVVLICAERAIGNSINEEADSHHSNPDWHRVPRVSPSDIANQINDREQRNEASYNYTGDGKLNFWLS